MLAYANGGIKYPAGEPVALIATEHSMNAFRPLQAESRSGQRRSSPHFPVTRVVEIKFGPVASTKALGRSAGLCSEGWLKLDFHV